jgi:hypothetical protein
MQVVGDNNNRNSFNSKLSKNKYISELALAAEIR